MHVAMQKQSTPWLQLLNDEECLAEVRALPYAKRGLVMAMRQL